MPTGTKVVLAVLGLLVGVLVVYYGFMLPDATLAALGEPETATQTSEATPNTVAEPAAQSAVGAQSAGSPANNQAEASPGMLSSALDRLSEMTQDISAIPPAAIARDTLRPADVSQPTNPGLMGRFADPGNAASTPVTNPLSANQPLARPAGPQPVVYTDYYVREGDTLSEIAQGWFGDANKWDAIVRVNRGLDPLRLQIGQRILLPSRDVTSPQPSRVDTLRIAPPRSSNPVLNTQSVFHVVTSGENLSRISGTYYGSTAYWERIFMANRLTLNGDPDLLRVGMKLIIPPAP